MRACDMIGCSPPLVMSHTDRIQQLLLEKPGLKAQQIASELALERSEVAAALHTLAGGEVTQDSSYRWWPAPPPPPPAGGVPAQHTISGGRPPARPPADPAPPSRSLIARLSRYY